MGWAQEEFETIDLSDVRLNARAAKLAQRLAEKPSERIPNACQGWAETQAAYRFLSSTNWSALMQSHWNATMKRMRGHEAVLNIQDTTELNFNGRQSERGLAGCVTKRNVECTCIRPTR